MNKSNTSINAIEIFSSLSFDTLNKLEQIRQVRTYSKGDAVFSEGKNLTGVYCVHHGYVKIFRHGKDGNNNTIMFIAQEGELIGWEQLTEQSYSKNAEAIEDSTLSFFPGLDFLDIVKEDKDFSFLFAKILCKGKLRLEAKLFHVFQDSLRQRLAINILLLIEKFGAPHEENIILNVPLSREDLASIIGTNTETLVKLLSQFKREGTIDFINKRMIIINSPILQKICDHNI